MGLAAIATAPDRPRPAINGPIEAMLDMPWREFAREVADDRWRAARMVRKLRRVAAERSLDGDAETADLALEAAAAIRRAMADALRESRVRHDGR